MGKNVALGNLLQERRHVLGWSTENSADLYSQFVRPIKAKTIWKIEEGVVPKDLKRRLVLARMYQLAPAVLGVPLLKSSEKILLPPRPTRHIDLQENQAVLLSYWKQGYDDPKAAIRDLYARAITIQSVVLYTAGREREEMLRTLCGYKIWLGHVFREQGYYKNALHHFNDAIILAHEEDFSLFEASALYRRGEFFLDQREFKKAEKDFEKALLIKALPAQVKARIKVILGLAKSHLAQTEKEKTEAWNLLKGIDSLAGVEEDQLYLLHMSIGSFHRYSARVYMGPSVKKLRDPGRADESLQELEKRRGPYQPGRLRLYSYDQFDSAVVEAQIDRDKGYYPLVVERAMAAIKMNMEMYTVIHVPLLKSIYEDLCTSSYGKDISVAELGLQLLLLEYPQVFH